MFGDHELYQRYGFTSNGASGASAHEMVAAGLTIGHSSLKVYKNENYKEHGKGSDFSK